MTIKHNFHEVCNFTNNWFKDKSNLICVEIGVWYAYNASYCLGRWGQHVEEWHLIDPYNFENYHSAFKNDRKNHKKIALENTKKFSDKCVWFENYSYEVVDNYKDDSIDFLYIDGNHSYDSVLKDIKLYWPKVKRGGLVIFDDYNEPDVAKAVHEFFKDRKVETTSTFPAHAFILK